MGAEGLTEHTTSAYVHKTINSIARLGAKTSKQGIINF